ncbi:secretory lipase-like protein 1 precursor [Mollisia scopiformis]|uniref:Secretory lipase-like protein 1 n=1 Tax=Mollisia scopiformis TaxID=149040 RepID=A0A194XSZ2_MOLSC|nr:secretory lipase-like protein 1 precursor [Mollisia scopiformis]KUJ23261.1 secretory lipase-like protein 1 precursor [Mollisia scopiformis]
MIMAFSTLSEILTAFVVFTIASGSPLPHRDVSKPPTKDPFYSHASGFKDASPGTILKHRTPPGELGDFGTIPLNLQSSHQIQYRTTNSQGNPDTAVTTVLVPEGGNMSRLVSYQDIQDASYLNCAPSYAIQVGSDSNNSLSKSSSIFEAGLLSQGYIVSIPDYQGTQAAFSSGIQAGQATLDSIRAVLSSSSITGISSKHVDVTMWGYSGGSIATGWAAEMQPSYAPELKIAGAAIGGTVVNLNNTIHTMNKSQYAGLGLAGLWGLYQGFPSPELEKLLDDETFLENRTELESPRSQCAGADFSQFDGKDVFKYFRNGEGILNSSPLREIIEKAGVMGKRDVPQIPLYFYKAKGDQVNSIDDNDALVKSYCDRGISSLEYVRSSIGDHTSESMVGSGGAVKFLKDRFNGVPPTQGCKTSDFWFMDLDWDNFKMFGNELVGAVKAMFGVPFKV